MPFHYPNGKLYLNDAKDNPKKQPKNQEVRFDNRGMSLEEEINESNRYYLAHDIAVVYKKPLPIQIVKVDYPKRSAAVIKEAYFRKPSTTDYNGVYKGYYLDFEAKETKNKASFPLKNFHQHQIEHMRHCLRQDGICFVIIRFVSLKRLFVYPATPLIRAWDTQETVQGRKSIPLKTIETEGFEIHYALNPLIPYLSAVEQLIHYLESRKGVHYGN
ncbi:Holliday junction resolvase RecU [Loigolactobacillus backii]|uniref:Holliday junction resolvase RecU n=1 Tax=Loigolactobacillus backii TaxID=375175 RepID=A0A192H3X1_9LACO|nr:Holliday junction resolvase RecU [Loigolactobacillus backii]ANK59522.1 Holliday junction resolvase RecU [Loigolactobacillus backii]ANK62917.1 Holliday junction resolvase RecU [Loigolactobacillus backii]ANK64515.1 Holliday junction resolvase RecU [Loigolactobacillus backii]ANK67089.1 Holliday junction resolvase RecU [Loigolactobacillus backii]ANK70075.1 Holliday junction resolvase RecU [Loigolactobacillus backii]